MTQKPPLKFINHSPPQTNFLPASQLGAAKRIGKKVVYQVKKPESVAVEPSPEPKPSASASSAISPKKSKPIKQQMPDQEAIAAYRKEKAGQGVDWLIAHYPAVFTPNNKKPLNIGIHKQIRLLNPAVPRGLLAIGLEAWINTSDYYEAVIAGTERYDLEGKPCGVITDEQKEHARKCQDAIVQKKS